jgi:hypothetical protein
LGSVDRNRSQPAEETLRSPWIREGFCLQTGACPRRAPNPFARSRSRVRVRAFAFARAAGVAPRGGAYSSSEGEALLKRLFHHSCALQSSTKPQENDSVASWASAIHLYGPCKFMQAGPAGGPPRNLNLYPSWSCVLDIPWFS